MKKKYLTLAARLICTWVILMFFSNARSQVELVKPDQLQSMTPASPNAAALAKYGELQVSTYNGLPDISVPIFKIVSGKVQAPLSLSYHPVGVRVEEVASSVGLGWSLNLPGAIVRQTRGLPDEQLGGYYSSRESIYKYHNDQMSEIERQSFLNDISNGLIDTEPDLYTYSINGVSGSFFYNENDEVVTIPRSTISIGRMGSGWSIIDNNGIMYVFSNPETTLSVPSTSIGSTTGYNQFESITSWFITRMESVISPDDKIEFEYETFTSNNITISSQTKYISNTADGGCPQRQPSSFYSTNTITGQRLKKIVFKSGYIELIRQQTQRLDFVDDFAVDHIAVRNNSGTLHRKISFDYTYSVSDGESAATNSFKQYYYRLMLAGISINDGIEGNYSFEYNTRALPNRLSYSQDFWGYYNGADNQNSFAPTTTLTPTGGGAPITHSGADRAVNPITSQAAILTRISYPTGGHTDFVFENNYILTSVATSNTIRNQGYVSVGTLVEQGNGFTTSPTFVIQDCTPNDTIPYEICQLTVFNSGCGGGLENLECPRVTLYEVTNGYVGPVNASGNIPLLPGTYYLQMDVSGVTDPQIANSAYAYLYYPTCSTTVINGTAYVEQVSGGHRLAMVSTYDQSNRLASKKIYTYKDPQTGFSTGRSLSLPQYISSSTQMINVSNSNNEQFLITCPYISVSSSSNYPLSNTKSSSTGYWLVTEINGSPKPSAAGLMYGGKTEYYYTTSETNPDLFDYDFPFPPSTTRDWQRGNLTKQIVYKNLVSGFQKVQEKTIEYAEDGYISLLGLKTGQDFFPSNPSDNSQFLKTKSYEIQSGWFKAVKETNYVYDQVTSSKSFRTVSEFAHNSSNLQIKEAKGDAKVGKIVNKIKYPQDYSLIETSGENDNNAIKNLIGKNFVNLPIEQISIRVGANNEQFVVAGKIILYRTDLPLPAIVYDLKTIAPIPLLSYVESSIGSNGQLLMDSRYEAAFYYAYDFNGNLNSVRKAQDLTTSYIWGYGNEFITAEVTNATPAEIAATSFEGESYGGWVGIIPGNITADKKVPTGSYYYALSAGGLTKNNLPLQTGLLHAAKGYTVSYWSNNGQYSVTGTDGPVKQGRTVTINGQSWTYFEHLVGVTNDINTVTVTGNGGIDELRLYPRKAFMSSYTHEPLLGITTVCNPNSQISYYEYDLQGRLKLIRDQERNIMKSFEYKYQEQQD